MSVAGRLMLRRVQGKLAFGTLQDSTGSHPAVRPVASRTPGFDEFCRPRLGDWIGVRGAVMTTRRGELSVRVDEWALLAHARRPVPRQVARHHRPRHPLPPALRRPVGHRGGPARRFLLRSRLVSPHPAVARGPRLHRGRDAGVPPDPRRRHGQAVHHPPQRPRPRPVPAHRARAVPEAARRRRLREGVRDRPGVPQRGPLAPAQPRVHDARAVRGLRRLRRHDAAHRGARRPPRHRAAGHDQAHLPGPRPRPHAAVAAGDDGRAHRGARRRPRRRPPARRGAAGDPATSTASRARTTWGTGQARPRALREDDRGRALGPGVRHRLPEGGLAARPRPPRGARAWSSGSRPIVAGRELVQRLQRAHRPRRAARHLRGPGRGEGGRRRRGDGRRRGLPARPRVRPAAHRRARHRHRPAGDAARRRRRRSAT